MFHVWILIKMVYNNNNMYAQRYKQIKLNLNNRFNVNLGAV